MQGERDNIPNGRCRMLFGCAHVVRGSHDMFRSKKTKINVVAACREAGRMAHDTSLSGVCQSTNACVAPASVHA